MHIRVVAVLLALLTSACGPAAGGGADGPSPQAEAGSTRHSQPVNGSDARMRQVYDAVLRRYLGRDAPMPGSGPNRPAVVYVVHDAFASAADPETTGRAGGVPIPDEVQRAVTRDLADLARVRWVDNRDDVIVEKASCPHVRGGGIVITMAPVPPAGDRVEVGVGGFAACLGGSWLTYVVQTGGSGWTVSGTTGAVAIS